MDGNGDLNHRKCSLPPSGMVTKTTGDIAISRMGESLLFVKYAGNALSLPTSVKKPTSSVHYSSRRQRDIDHVLPKMHTFSFSDLKVTDITISVNCSYSVIDYIRVDIFSRRQTQGSVYRGVELS